MWHRSLIFAALFLITTLYALVRGGAPERSVAVACFTAYAATVFVTLHKYHAYYALELGVLAIDVALAAVLTALALSANRIWTIWAASFQLVGITAHLVKLIVPEILAPAYAATLIIWSYAMIPVLLLATIRHRRRIANYGNDPDWSVMLQS